MRKFSSYGPIQTNRHYHAPRTSLVKSAQLELTGEYPDEGGHYITVWAPRQTGKSWVMLEVVQQLKKEDTFEVAMINFQSAKTLVDDKQVLKLFVRQLQDQFDLDFPLIDSWAELGSLFTSAYFSKPMILIIDEFDALQEEFINRFANEFRSIYLSRGGDVGTPSSEKKYLLHGLALIGVRSVLGIENITGSPFNVQRSVQIPNLERAEVVQIFQDFQDESGRQIAPDVVARIYDEMQGQPGLTCWLGELLTEINIRRNGPITMDDFEYTYSHALNVQPNNNILNIISKAKQPQYKPIVLEMFQVGSKLPFRYDDPETNYLYMNGVVSYEETQDKLGHYQQFLRFPSPFVQKRLFNYFAHDLFMGLKRLYDPFTDLSNTITDTHLDIDHIVRLYEAYLHQNQDWLFKNAPRRKTDEHIYEAVYHFSLYMYLVQFLEGNAAVVPEFPTGNGKIDLVVHHSHTVYPLEVKSFINRQKHQEALVQAVQYAQQLKVAEAWLISFVEVITDEQRASVEVTYQDVTTGVAVHSIFVAMHDL
ncbi:MAG: AAA-like domain-containing protein [Chloroflexota bacterium]